MKTKSTPKKIENIVYASTICLCEHMESKGQYKGNGHHLAQRLCVLVAEGTLTKQEKTVYSVMDTHGMSAKEIGEKCGYKFSSKLVSAILRNIQKKCSLIGCKGEERKKTWYKYYDTSDYYF